MDSEAIAKILNSVIGMIVPPRFSYGGYRLVRTDKVPKNNTLNKKPRV
jgi:hypothetical protein